MWFDEAIFYQFYPLGLCGAPRQNDGNTVSRISGVTGWIPHLKKLGVDAVYFSPVFDSDSHGYDTRDYRKIDCRLGTNGDFAAVCRALHGAGMRVVLDGVFNHVGRGFWAFCDVREHRENSAYRDWFNISFDGNSNYGDGFWYEGWEGHYELVKLNLQNSAVREYLLDCVRMWVEEFKIDGLRLDVAYMLDEGFLRSLREFTTGLKPDFFLLGEMLHGDYKRLVNDAMLHSATNYECYKGLHSSFNSMNLFEVGHSLNRQFGPEQWTLYKGLHLLSFLDNHDVSRIASVLQDKIQLPALYALLFGMPGIPCLYYGSEWGIEGEKQHGDDCLRPALDTPLWNDLTDWVGRCATARKHSPALQYGSYRPILLTNHQFIFERAVEGERVLVAINIDSESYSAHFNAEAGCADELITGSYHDFGGGSTLPPHSANFWRTR